jgi:hypothetical protein
VSLRVDEPPTRSGPANAWRHAFPAQSLVARRIATRYADISTRQHSGALSTLLQVSRMSRYMCPPCPRPIQSSSALPALPTCLSDGRPRPPSPRFRHVLATDVLVRPPPRRTWPTTIFGTRGGRSRTSATLRVHAEPGSRPRESGHVVGADVLVRSPGRRTWPTTIFGTQGGAVEDDRDPTSSRRAGISTARIRTCRSGGRPRPPSRRRTWPTTIFRTQGGRSRTTTTLRVHAEPA